MTFPSGSLAAVKKILVGAMVQGGAYRKDGPDKQILRIEWWQVTNVTMDAVIISPMTPRNGVITVNRQTSRSVLHDSGAERESDSLPSFAFRIWPVHAAGIRQILGLAPTPEQADAVTRYDQERNANAKWHADLAADLAAKREAEAAAKSAAEMAATIARLRTQ